jgi:hypothetical protein
MQSLRALRETQWASTQATENLRTFRRDLHDECMRRRADALFEVTDAVLTAGLVPSPPHLRASPPCTGGAGAASTQRSRRGESTMGMCGSCARVTLWPKAARRSTRWRSGRTCQPFRRRPFAPYVERRAELPRTPFWRSSHSGHSRKLDFHFTEFSEVRIHRILRSSRRTLAVGIMHVVERLARFEKCEPERRHVPCTRG